MAGQTGVFAGGTIYPSTIVRMSDEYTVVVAGAAPTTPLFGVAQENTRRPNVFTDGDAAALSGEPIRVYQQGQKCKVRCGGTITAGNYITSGASGYAVAWTTETYIVAQALEDGVSGDYIWCHVQPQQV